MGIIKTGRAVAQSVRRQVGWESLGSEREIQDKPLKGFQNRVVGNKKQRREGHLVRRTFEDAHVHDVHAHTSVILSLFAAERKKGQYWSTVPEIHLTNRKLSNIYE